MRNVLEYPITDKERIETLEQIKNDILAQETIGDLRAEILQECIELIKSNSVTIQLSADERTMERINKLEKWYQEQQHRARENILSTLKLAGLKSDMWKEWTNNPPPVNSYNNGFDLITCAILDALTDGGYCAWAGAGVNNVTRIVRAQFQSRKKLLHALENIADLQNADVEALRQIAKDAILNEKPIE